MPLVRSLLLLTLALALHGGAAQAASAGFRTQTISDPAGGEIEIGIWYPSNAAPQPVDFGLGDGLVAPGATPAGRHLPLVVMSHGNGGAFAGHFDTAIALAQAGFVVAALTHSGDNWRDQSRATEMANRPRQLKLLIDHMVGAPDLRDLVDAKRIGAFGFSSGGFTVLAAAGADPDLDKVVAHCRERPQDFDCKLSEGRRPAPPQAWTHDGRIRAVVSAAPALGYTFTKANMRGLRVPVQLWKPAADEILPAPLHADAVLAALPRRPEYHPVPGATHFVFLAPCSAQAAKSSGAICADPAGFDRAAFHAAFNRDVIAFFRRTLAPR
ncbi:prolyl oligopeptidase family serine peptidase [Sphingosinicella sp. BN140058]|uniref:alpha/beta hydrolase family protein n=1 Tax=Sphingosinicella sp. BN140058 TaxID=1892855 RepID=UPI001010AB32|nr:prolyl oligopeptidase family serine peptidase [Sphingosinicella sp. BN140058]QAY76406.1 dienelactone hydrolase [Sphingosinicella sp. BN140058]